MNSRYFLISLLAFSFCLQLLRFPHLILENGGGAFLILFFVVLNVLAFPMLIVEKVIDNKLNEIDLRSLIYIKKSNSRVWWDRFFVGSWFGLRVSVLLCFLWFFLYLGSSSVVYLFYFVGTSLASSRAVVDVPNLPEMSLSLIGPTLWITLSFLLFVRFFDRFVALFTHWVLPFCYLVFFMLFVKIIILVSDYEGLKTLFYPDFLALSAASLLSSVGHSLASLSIGVGFYKCLFVPDKNVDHIEISIRAVILSISVAIIVGIMALPMIEQVSESPFGSSWLFQILPRWLSYGKFGNYYCGLFFLGFSLLSLYISVILYSVVGANMTLLYRFKKRSKRRWAVNSLYIMVNVLVVFYMQTKLQGWTGQSWLLGVDNLVINYLLPLFALMMIWVVFWYTSREERLAVFDKQQIFFHNQIFFKIWEKLTWLVVPSLILLAWLARNFL